MSEPLELSRKFITASILASIADRPSLFSELIAAKRIDGSVLSRFMPSHISSLHEKELAAFGSAWHAEVDGIVAWSKKTSDSDFREFAKATMQVVAGLSGFEEFYRTFDAMDEILGLDYGRDLGMTIDPENKERLYEGAGLGVQSSYTTLTAVLEDLAPLPGASFIDLGSGYGRAGLVVGLLRPDMDFIGYEYVGHRVEVSEKSASRAGVSGKVKFFTQDLSDRSFAIPRADIYYLFDPFTEETYTHVFEQLKTIGLEHEIAVAAKGGAVRWFEKAVAHGGWTKPEKHDIGTLSIFRSRV